MYRLDQAEQKIIFEHLEKHVETENTFIENIRYKVTDNYMHRNNEVEMAMTLIDVIYENISKLDAFSVEETIEGILFKFKADIVGDSRISLLEERLKNRQHIIKKYTLE